MVHLFRDRQRTSSTIHFINTGHHRSRFGLGHRSSFSRRNAIILSGFHIVFLISNDCKSLLIDCYIIPA